MPTSPPKERLLIVDDAADTREVLQRNLHSHGYQVLTATEVGEAVQVLDSTPVDLVITDLKMPGASGMDLVKHVRENLRDTEVMMITGFPTVEGAARSVKVGAEEYLAKPFTQEELLTAVRRSLDKLRIKRASRSYDWKTETSLCGLVGESDGMRKVFESVQKAADSPDVVLITGESGTGKELVARAIHYRSPRASAPFVPANCGGIPRELLESEFFGHVKGAFPGATETRAGFFQTAEGGTIFLDEISEMSQSMQVKLLRVLQDREVCMAGSTRPRTADVRVLAATNMELSGLVSKGAFREDLFHRLNAITISLPPLRERGNDAILLARRFASTFAKECGKPEPRFSDHALEIFRSYPWPGNVRELQETVRRLVVATAGDAIDASDLPSLMRFSPFREPGLTRTLAEVEAEYIRNVLAHVGGNKTRAAEVLGIDRKTLREKLKIPPAD